MVIMSSTRKTKQANSNSRESSIGCQTATGKLTPAWISSPWWWRESKVQKIPHAWLYSLVSFAPRCQSSPKRGVHQSCKHGTVWTQLTGLNRLLHPGLVQMLRLQAASLAHTGSAHPWIKLAGRFSSPKALSHSETNNNWNNKKRIEIATKINWWDSISQIHDSRIFLTSRERLISKDRKRKSCNYIWWIPSLGKRGRNYSLLDQLTTNSFPSWIHPTASKLS